MISVRLLRPEDERSDFSCGNIELDYYFQKFAGQNQFKNYIGSNYVAVKEGEVLGFISVSSGELLAESLTPGMKKALPAYPLPVLRITRLGVATAHQHKGIGTLLLRQMLLLAIEQKKSVGCFGVVVDAKEEAVVFYKKLGFVRLENVKRSQTVPMFLGTKVIEKVVGDVQG